jgi:signal transduction histidine kinase/ligand-binding sensor domain-containing protein
MARRLTLFCLLAAWLGGSALEALAQVGGAGAAGPLGRQVPSLRFDHLGLADGMAQLSVQEVLQDRQGFLWLATGGGLHRYDGYGFDVFAPEPFDTTSLSGSSLSGLSESADGTLWVATFSSGLNRFDPATGRATRYRHDPADSTTLGPGAIAKVLETANGDVWALTGASGLSRMRADAPGRFEHVRHDPNDPHTLSSNFGSGLSEDAQGNVWVGTTDGANRIDARSGRVTRFFSSHEGGPSYAVHKPYLPPEDPATVWLPTTTGLVRLNPANGAHERFLVDPDPANPRNRFYTVLSDPDDPDVLWISGSGAGLVRFDARTRTFTAYRADAGDPTSLSSDDVLSMARDRTGRFWIGTRSDGLSAFNPSAVDFRHVRHRPGDAASLPPGTASALLVDAANGLWVVTQPSRNVAHLTHFDPESGRPTRYEHRPSDARSLQPGAVGALITDPGGNVWTGHLYPGGGLSRIDARSGRVTRHGYEQTPETIRRNHTARLLPSATEPHLLWVGTADGLHRFDTRAGRFESQIDLSGVASTPAFATPLHHDAAGTLWAYVEGAGLVAVSSSGAAARAAAHDPADTTSITSNLISDVHERAAEPGVLWLATQAGLNRIDTRSGRVRHYLRRHGLPSNVVYGLLEDAGGTLWMSTDNGIVNFDPDAETFRTYGLEDGLLALEYGAQAYARGPDGTLYFGSAEGVTAFTPERLRPNPVPPQVAITAFKVNNAIQTVGAGGLLQTPLHRTERVVLDHRQNELGFEFVGLHFANPGKNRYAYRLHGHDQEWIATSADQRAASYSNLAPGDYVFHVRAANPDGVWNDEGARLALTIRPPWWQTPWAYALFALLAVGLVAGAGLVQRRRLLSKAAERARLREAELHAEAQARRHDDAERLSAIGRTITSTLSVEEVLQRVYEHVNDLMDATIFAVGVYDAAGKRLVFPAAKERGETLRPYANRLDDADRPAVWCFTHGEPIVAGDWAREYARYVPSHAPPIAGGRVASMVYLPLTHQGRAVGVLTVQSYTPNAYTDYHVSVLKTLATYAAIALDNAEAYRRLDRTLAELRATQEQLVQQEKLASLGQLTAGIAHEIKNPLNFITGFSSLSGELVDDLRAELEQGGDPEEVRALLDDLAANAAKIEEHGRRADAIVRSMMAHARSSGGERAPVDLNALVDEHVDLAWHGRRAQDIDFRVEVVRDYAADVPSVEAAAQDLGRVVLNLVGNAFDAVTEHAQKSGPDYAPRITVATRRSGDFAEVRVSDNGPGIAPDLQARIFEPFFTTKPAGSGTGLGLSLSHDIVAQGHGGTLTVESTPGEGATFVLRLPAPMLHPVSA